jgi:diguanylate cyclase (GGDEF)-like protein
MNQLLDSSEQRMMLLFATLQNTLYFVLTAFYWNSPTFYWLLILFFMSLVTNGFFLKKWNEDSHSVFVLLYSGLNLLLSFTMISLTGNMNSPFFPMYYLPTISISALALVHKKNRMLYISVITSLASVLTFINAMTSYPLSFHEWTKMGVFCISYFSFGFSVMLYQQRLKNSLHHSEIDHLTQVYNKRIGEKLLGDALIKAEKKGDTISVAFCDIDHFKEVNDSFGHLCGDECLRTVSQFLLDYSPEDSIVVRWGGEEFMLVFKGLGQDEAFNVMETIRVGIEKYEFNHNNQSFALTLSCGVMEVPPPANNLVDVLDQVDKLLYHAKNKGRNQVATASDLQS